MSQRELTASLCSEKQTQGYFFCFNLKNIIPVKFDLLESRMTDKQTKATEGLYNFNPGD